MIPGEAILVVAADFATGDCNVSGRSRPRCSNSQLEGALRTTIRRKSVAALGSASAAAMVRTWFRGSDEPSSSVPQPLAALLGAPAGTALVSTTACSYDLTGWTAIAKQEAP